MLGIIKTKCKHIDRVAFIMLYKSLVRSYLEHVNSVWSPHKQYLIEELEKMQKRATTLVSACKKLSYEQIVDIYLKLPTLKYSEGGHDRDIK